MSSVMCKKKKVAFSFPVLLFGSFLGGNGTKRFGHDSRLTGSGSKIRDYSRRKPQETFVSTFPTTFFSNFHGERACFAAF